MALPPERERALREEREVEEGRGERWDFGVWGREKEETRVRSRRRKIIDFIVHVRDSVGGRGARS